MAPSREDPNPPAGRAGANAKVGPPLGNEAELGSQVYCERGFAAPPVAGPLPSEPWLSMLGVQCFLARTALGWSMKRPDRAAEVSPLSVAHFEREGTARANTIEAIQRALEDAGVIFVDANDGGPGARLRDDRDDSRAKF